MAAFPLYAPVLPFLHVFDIASLMCTNRTMRDWVANRIEHRKQWSDKRTALNAPDNCSVATLLKYDASLCGSCHGYVTFHIPVEYYRTTRSFHLNNSGIVQANSTRRFRLLCTKCQHWTCWTCESSHQLNRCCIVCFKCTNSKSPRACNRCLKEHCPLHPEPMGEKAIYCKACLEPAPKIPKKKRKAVAMNNKNNNNTANTSLPTQIVIKAYTKRMKRKKLA